MSKLVLQKLFTWRTAICDSDLSATTRHVLLTLSLYMNEMGQSAFPSTKTLEENTGLSEKCVITHLQKAEELGWIEKRVHGYSGRGWKRHEYLPFIPNKALNEVQHVNEQGTEPHAQGTEPHDIKALNEVQSITPVNSPSNSPVKTPIDNARANETEFIPPTLEQCKTHLLNLGASKVHAEPFVLHFKSVGWKVGFGEKPMVDWESALQKWVMRSSEFKSPGNFKNENSKPNRDKPKTANTEFWDSVSDAIPDELRSN